MCVCIADLTDRQGHECVVEWGSLGPLGYLGHCKCVCVCVCFVVVVGRGGVCVCDWYECMCVCVCVH